MRTTAVTGGGRIRSLDGLRGLAVAAVVVYHLNAKWLPGGFLVVSVFFTLSGFVITRLLLAEQERSGGVDLGAFYQRRVRRLLPPSLATVAGTVVALVIAHQWTRATGWDVIAIVGQVANWRQALSHHGYGALFGPESPFKHFWSLAIEEQFYLVLPAVVIVALRRGRGALVATFAALMLVSLAAGHVGASDGRYFRTDVRAFELLVGCLLAVFEPRVVRGAKWLGACSAAAVALLGVLCVIVGTDQPMLYSVVLPVSAGLSALVIAGAGCAGTLVARVLSASPFVALGRVSYSVYLVHWPVNQLVSGTAARLAITTIATAALHMLVERPPIRLPVGLVLGFGYSLGIGSFVGLIATGIVPVGGVTVSAAASSPVAVIDAGATTVAPVAPLKVVVLGDSTGEFLGRALADQPELAVSNLARRGCPLLDMDVDVDVQLVPKGPFKPWHDHTGERQICDWRTYVDSIPTADVIVLVAGPTMLVDYRLANEATNVTEPEGRAFFTAGLERLRERLVQHAPRIVWVTGPESAKPGWYWSSGERADAWNAVLRDVAAEASNQVVDFAEWFGEQPDSDTYRPDGAHLEGAGAHTAAAWVASELTRIV